MLRLSFCTTCSNRAHQLKETFEKNVRALERCPEADWVILNYNSRDDLDEFMRRRLSASTPQVVYVREVSGRPWHAAVAKNVAHRVAGGAVLMNLDCDNFIGNAPELIEEAWNTGVRILHLWSGKLGDGTYGRVAVAREVFHALGGYDEAFYPMGYQDYDLIGRAAAAGVKAQRVASPSGLSLPNTKAESIEHCAIEGMTWEDFNRANRARSMANIAAGRLVANQPHGWAPMKIERVEVPRVRRT